MRRVIAPLLIGAASAFSQSCVGHAQERQKAVVSVEERIDIHKRSNAYLTHVLLHEPTDCELYIKSRRELFDRVASANIDGRLKFLSNDAFCVRDRAYALIMRDARDRFSSGGDGMTSDEIAGFLPDISDDTYDRETVARMRALHSHFGRMRRQYIANKGTDYQPSQVLLAKEHVTIGELLSDIFPVGEYNLSELSNTEIDPRGFYGKKKMEVIDILHKKYPAFYMKNVKGKMQLESYVFNADTYTVSDGSVLTRMDVWMDGEAQRASIDFLCEQDLCLIRNNVSKVQGRINGDCVDLTPYFPSTLPSEQLIVKFSQDMRGSMDIDIDVDLNVLPCHKIILDCVEKSFTFSTEPYICTVRSITKKDGDPDQNIIVCDVDMRFISQGAFPFEDISGMFYGCEGGTVPTRRSHWYEWNGKEESAHIEWHFGKDVPDHGVVLVPVFEPIVIKKTIRIPNVRLKGA